MKINNMETALEKVLMSFYKEGMIIFVNSNPQCFDELIELSLSDKQPYSWRAAWLLHDCMENNDSRINVKEIINSISTKKDGHQRELLRILLKMELDEDDEGYIFDICITVWEGINKKPSVRYIAFRLILKIIKKHPNLSNEISFLTQNQYLDTLSPGIKGTIIKMVKEF